MCSSTDTQAQPPSGSADPGGAGRGSRDQEDQGQTDRQPRQVDGAGGPTPSSNISTPPVGSSSDMPEDRKGSDAGRALPRAAPGGRGESLGIGVTRRGPWDPPSRPEKRQEQGRRGGRGL